MGGAEEFAERGDQVGEAVPGVVGAGGAQPGDYGDRRGRGAGQSGQPRGVRRPEQFGLDDGSGAVDARVECGGARGAQGPGGGPLLLGGGLGLGCGRLFPSGFRQG